jgi:Trk K+ transport system NAD-binding subunit
LLYSATALAHGSGFLAGASEFRVAPGSLADGSRVADLPIGDQAWLTLVVRDGAAIQPGASLELQAGDRVLVLADPDDVEATGRPFRTPVSGASATRGGRGRGPGSSPG